MEVIVRKTEKARVKKVRSLILSAGNTFGSVHFRKRSDGSKRKLSFRLNSQNPTYAQKPGSGKFSSRKAKDSDNNMLTVIDANIVIRAKSGRRKGKISGRGDWRTISIETVERVCVKGKIYKIKK